MECPPARPAPAKAAMRNRVHVGSLHSAARRVPCLVIALTAVGAAGHNCIHDSHIVPSLLRQKHFPYKVPQDEVDPAHDGLPDRGLEVRMARRLQVGGNPLRIKVDYSYLDNDKYQCTAGSSAVVAVDGSVTACSPDDVITAEKRAYIRRLTDAAVDWFSRTLNVLRPTTGPLKLRKFCYQFAPPPNGDAETEINHNCFSATDRSCLFELDQQDFALTVAASPTQGGTLAYALTCQSDADTGRPIAGLVNYGASTLTMHPLRWASELSTAIHEVAHALGFSASKFGDFIDASGRPLGVDNVVRRYIVNGKVMSRIVTPRVVEMVKRQFDCYDWPEAGGDLEDFGGSGTAGSHWDKRNFRDEFMTGTDSENAVYSSISLALFEDSGWYKADYSMGDHMAWGYKAGCTFAKATCDRWDRRFFCRVPGSEGCSHDRFFKSYCNLVKYEDPLPVQTRYFPEDATLGGRDAHADYCPYYAGYTDGDCRVPAFGHPGALMIYGEVLGNSSRCFDSTIVNDDYLQPEMGQRCYKTVCERGVLSIDFGGTLFRCPTFGGEITVNARIGSSSYGGTLVCPPAVDVCSARSSSAPSLPVVVTTTEPPSASTTPASPSAQPTVAELVFGAAESSVSIAVGQVSYFLINLAKATSRSLLLENRGLSGASLYVRVHQPRNGGTAETVTMPSKANSDFSVLLSADRPVELPASLQDRGSQLYVAIAAPAAMAAPLNGKVKLSRFCALGCLNGGSCVDGVCVCKPGWAGLRCQDRPCPNDCSGHGRCDISQGKCACGVGWTGDGCAAKEQPTSGITSGQVPVGSWTYFWVSCGDTAAMLTYRLTKKTVGSDPFLYVQAGHDRPQSTSYVVRDLSSWKAWSNVHTVTLPVRGGPSGGATIGIWNVREYARESLTYQGSLVCQPDNTPKPCPSTAAGTCNGKGTCAHDAVDNVDRCTCQTGWVGTGCDEPVVQVSRTGNLLTALPLGQNDAVYVRLQMNSSVFGQSVEVALQGLPNWVGVSANKGSRRVAAAAPKVSDFNNYRFFDSSQSGAFNKVTLRPVDQSSYSLMFINTKIEGIATADLVVTVAPIDDGSTPTPPADGMLLLGENGDQTSTSQDYVDPAVPLAIIAEDGTLPRPVLTLSSRASIKGMASSMEMELLRIDEFCQQSSTGLYVKCSNLDGDVTVCSDAPTLLFFYSRNVRPKDTSEFSRRSSSVVGPPPKKFDHLASWQDSCQHHAIVPVDEDHAFIGVAARDPGQVVSFQAVMQGKSSLFLTDTGDLRLHWYVLGWSLLAAFVSCCITSSCFFCCWRQKARAQPQRLGLRDARAVEMVGPQAGPQVRAYVLHP